jgi:hypothetical protein
VTRTERVSSLYRQVLRTKRICPHERAGSFPFAFRLGTLPQIFGTASHVPCRRSVYRAPLLNRAAPAGVAPRTALPRLAKGGAHAPLGELRLAASRDGTCYCWVVDPLRTTIEEFAADGFTHIECHCPRCRMTRVRPVGFHASRWG